MAAAAGIGAVRIIRSAERGPVGVTVRRLGRRLEQRATARGVRFPATATGLDEAGTLDASAPRTRPSTVWRQPRGRAPSWRRTPARPATPTSTATDWGYVWAEELAGLTDPAVRRRRRRGRVPPRHLCRSRGGGMSEPRAPTAVPARPDAEQPGARRLPRARPRRPVPRGGPLAVVPVPAGRTARSPGGARARPRMWPRLFALYLAAGGARAHGDRRRRRRRQARRGPAGGRAAPASG